MLQPFSDEYFMEKALQEAQYAYQKNEIPIGCIIVAENQIIARAHNLTETLTDVTAHAEIQAITSAANHLGGKYLTNCTIYITVEPCTMCAGAIGWAQISKVVYGASDNKKGYTQIASNALHPKCEVKLGVLEDKCADLMKSFFQSKRKASPNPSQGGEF